MPCGNGKKQLKGKIYYLRKLQPKIATHGVSSPPSHTHHLKKEKKRQKREAHFHPLPIPRMPRWKWGILGVFISLIWVVACIMHLAILAI